MEKFSVLMSTYENDNSEYFLKALNSVINQTVLPNEIIIVVDGPISEEYKEVIENQKDKYDIIKLIYLEKNSGLGNALKIGLEQCTYDIVARMDSDDIAKNDRFEKQLRILTDRTDISTVGGNISEFIDDENNIISRRVVPEINEDIVKYMKKRCPFNHMTVMFRKKDVLSVGNYIEWHYNEDYYLWLRLYLNNYQFYNIQDDLVNVRVGKDMYKRRGGWKYFQSERNIQKFMLSNKIISPIRYFINVCERLIIQVFMPNSLRGILFRKIARKKINS
ncbi:MAG: glycosyltransferase [Clostridia bacterium]|nr:glycosyltransferase [Clostridia bacterium]